MKDKHNKEFKIAVKNAKIKFRTYGRFYIYYVPWMNYSASYILNERNEENIEACYWDISKHGERAKWKEISLSEAKELEEYGE